MIKHSLKVAWRYMRKNLVFTLINISGITVGIAACLVIGIYIRRELSYDKYHQDYKLIYRLANQVEGASYENGIAKVSGPWGPAVYEQIPEIRIFCRFVFFGESLFENGKEKFYEPNGFYADSTVFSIFSWKLLKGDPQSALTVPHSIVISRDFSEKYFGHTNPVGKTLRVDNDQLYQVTGLMENIPSNSHFHFDFLVSLSGYHHPDMDDWVRWPQFYTYVLLKPGSDIKQVQKKTDALLAQHLDSTTSRAYTPFFQPLADIHLHSDLFREMESNSSISYIYIFATLGIFILLIACLNFVNLSTAQASKRSGEVGIRKVNGATSRSLILQFLSEAFLLVLFAMILAILLTSIAIPTINRYLGMELTWKWKDLLNWGILLLGIAVFLSLLSGLYPAVRLSSFKPVWIKEPPDGKRSRFNLRSVLILSQFIISIVMIMAALVSHQQLKYIQNKKLGFNKDQVIYVPFQEPSSFQHIESIKQEIQNIPGVLRVAASGNRPGGGDYGVPSRVIGIPDDRQPAMRCLVVDEDFLDTYQMKIAAGRGFDKAFPSDSSAYLINEEAARQMGLKEPVGIQMEMPAIDRPAGPIIGVVKDFHFRSLHEKIAPLFFFMEKSWFGQVSIRIQPGLTEKTLSLLREKWKAVEPNHPLTYHFLDESFENMYISDQRTASLVRIFALFAIFIACLGLFGLSAHTVLQRTREISIRKVLGASATGLFALVSREFLSIVALAALCAFPIGWWLINRWLENFAYRISIGWDIFLASGLFALLIALLTVSYQSVRITKVNPAQTLKSE